MDVIFLGKFFPNCLLETIKEDSRGKIGMSNHNFEMSILNGLCKQEDIHLRCITLPGVFSFPHNNKKFFTKGESYDYQSIHIDSVEFCNLVGLKDYWSTKNCARLIVEAAESFSGSTVHVIINTPDLRLFNALSIAKKQTKKCFTQTVIVPDIPSVVLKMNNRFSIKSFLLARRNRKIMDETSNSDGLVLLTEAMMDFINKPVKHIVLEGLADIDTMDIEDVESVDGKQIILYTGTLRKVFGVMNLVNAFQLIPEPDVELWICGSGDSKEAIENAASKDSRIKFFGLVDSRKALELQRQATILVNPRTSEGEYTKYSFPSKTMEYLLAAKSVIINSLPGIPNEYYDYVYTPKNESVKALADCISYVLHLDNTYKKKRAFAGRQFIVEKKNSKIQVARILELIKSY